MFFRSLIAAALCFLGFGCSAESLADAFDPKGPTSTLAKLDEGTIAVLRGETRDLKVRYLDERGAPLPGMVVEFGLWGAAPGASLSPAQAETDESGMATTTLRAGSTNASFQVRASAPEAEPVFFDVRVGDAIPPTLSVHVAYSGARTIVSRTVTLVPGMRCEQLSQPYSEELRLGSSLVLTESTERAQFSLGSGLSYAVLAWGSDDTNSKRARACADIDKAPVTADESAAALMLTLELEDIALTVDRDFAVSVSLDVTPTMNGLKQVAEQAVFARLPPTPEGPAAFYLDFIESTLDVSDSDAFSAARVSLSLDATLTTLLNQAKGGPLDFAAALAQWVASQGGKAAISAVVSVPSATMPAMPTAFTVASVQALASDEARPIELVPGPLSGQATLSARYDDSRAAIAVEALSLELGLGSYASWLLDGLGTPQDFVRELMPSHGCAQVGRLVAEQPTLPINAAAATLRCEQAAASLVESVRSAFLELDDAQPSIWLAGLVAVHDRDGNGSADDIGPASLSGSWSVALEPAPQEAVTATLGVPTNSALAL